MGETTEKKRSVTKEEYFVVEGLWGNISFWVKELSYTETGVIDGAAFTNDIGGAKTFMKQKEAKNGILAASGTIPWVKFVLRKMERVTTTETEIMIHQVTMDGDIPVPNTSSWDERAPGGMS